VTALQHPSIGPVVGFGLGGAFADAIADRTHRSVPLTDHDGRGLVLRSRANEALQASGAETALVEDLVARVSALVDACPEITALTLNPILVSRSAAVVVDATAHVGPLSNRSAAEVPVRRLS